MKVPFVLSLLWICSNALEELLLYVCSAPDVGPACQKLKTFYWSDKSKQCVASRYLKDPCGFFFYEKRCTELCGSTNMTVEEAEKYISEL